MQGRAGLPVQRRRRDGGERGACLALATGLHRVLIAQPAHSMPAIIALDDDWNLTTTAATELEQLASHEHRAKPHEVLEVELDFGVARVHKLVGVDEPLADTQSISRAIARAPFRVDEVHE